LDNYRFDEDYVQLLTAGDPSVEAHFSEYFGKLLLFKLRNRLRSAEAIEDIRQETFLRVFQTLRKKGGLEHAERLGAFVNSVCNNVLLESFRSQARYVPLPEEASEPADRTVDLERALVSEDRRRMVELVLRKLSATDREILKMLFFEESDKQEICQMMGVSRDYLRVLVHRARLHFRAAMQKAETVVP
jgi:RNA polymerase sigma-70 factor, ECF subfamily